jgi:hypothetical protein
VDPQKNEPTQLVRHAAVRDVSVNKGVLRRWFPVLVVIGAAVLLLFRVLGH